MSYLVLIAAKTQATTWEEQRECIMMVGCRAVSAETFKHLMKVSNSDPLHVLAVLQSTLQHKGEPGYLEFHKMVVHLPS